jgi:hypothetical protein
VSEIHTIKVGFLGVKYSDDHISGRCPVCRKAAVVSGPEKVGDSWRVGYAHTISIVHDGRKPTLNFLDRCIGPTEHKHKTDAQHESEARAKRMAAKVE